MNFPGVAGLFREHYGPKGPTPEERRDLAAAVGVSSATASRWISGATKIAQANRPAVADHLDVSVEVVDAACVVSQPADDAVLRRVERLETLVAGMASQIRESLQGDQALVDLLDALESERRVRQKVAR